jgi:ATP-binding cassette, subfamily B (MDR/TAP), member 1
MSQNMAFFDDKDNSSGVLAAKLVSHPDEIEDLLGRNIPVILIILVTMIFCSTLAVIVGWKFGLVAIFGCLVPVCIAGYARIQLDYVIERRTQQLYYGSAGFAAEFIASMRTVVSLCLQDMLSSEYREMLRAPMRQAQRMGFLSYLFLALADSLQICGFALAFWYVNTYIIS